MLTKFLLTKFVANVTIVRRRITRAWGKGEDGRSGVDGRHNVTGILLLMMLMTMMIVISISMCTPFSTHCSITTQHGMVIFHHVKADQRNVVVVVWLEAPSFNFTVSYVCSNVTLT